MQIGNFSRSHREAGAWAWPGNTGIRGRIAASEIRHARIWRWILPRWAAVALATADAGPSDPSAQVSAGRNRHPNGGHVPACTQVNLSANYHWAAAPPGPIDVRCDIIDVGDAIYEIRDGSGVGVGAPQFGPRRGFFLGVTKNF